MKPRRPHRKPHAADRRRGLATLEVAMALPILVGMLSIIFTLANAGLTKTDVAITARQEAWQERHGERAGRTLDVSGANAVGGILGFRGNPAGGVIENRSVKNATALYPGFKGFTLEADNRHQVLAGTWDFPVDTRFAPRGEHPPLSPGRDTKFANFGIDGGLITGLLDGFRQLVSF
jgi:hypothetical protein